MTFSLLRGINCNAKICTGEKKQNPIKREKMGWKMFVLSANRDLQSTKSRDS